MCGDIGVASGGSGGSGTGKGSRAVPVSGYTGIKTKVRLKQSPTSAPEDNNTVCESHVFFPRAR